MILRIEQAETKSALQSEDRALSKADATTNGIDAKTGRHSRDSVVVEDLKSRIRRELLRHLRRAGFVRLRNGGIRPSERSKDGYRETHALQRRDRLSREAGFIARAWPAVQGFFADGTDVDPAKISPRLELVAAETWQSDLFRLASLTWSVPVSYGYGRRMRFLVWDDSNGKLMGLIALGDPVFNLRVRDDHIGWSLKYHQSRLVNVMDAYVLGAIPPYNSLLGGKLVACLIRTREIRDAFRKKYAGKRGVISKRRKNPHLVLVTTTSALGKSAVLDRLKLGETVYFESLGFTSGWGTFHISDELFALVRRYLSLANHPYASGHRFGDGPNWKLRSVRQAMVMLGIEQNLLNHGVPREVFACWFAQNGRGILSRRDIRRPYCRGLKSVAEVAELAKKRWIIPRAERRPDFRQWRKTGLKEILQLRGDETQLDPTPFASNVELSSVTS